MRARTAIGKNKTSSEVNKVTIRLFTQIPKTQRKTMTLDNGKEFSGHAELSRELGLLCYFANPYHSWERGLNEHTNGLLRQFFPKQTNFKIVKPEALEEAVMLINKRPRKSLDYKTPFEVLALIIVSATQAERSASSVRCNPYGTGL